jgi:hypothetical protein
MRTEFWLRNLLEIGHLEAREDEGKWILWTRFWKWEVDGTGTGSCPITGFSRSCVEPLISTIRDTVNDSGVSLFRVLISLGGSSELPPHRCSDNLPFWYISVSYGLVWKLFVWIYLHKYTLASLKEPFLKFNSKNTLFKSIPFLQTLIWQLVKNNYLILFITATSTVFRRYI